MTTIDELKNIYSDYAEKYDAKMEIVTIDEDPDLYGDATEQDYLPFYITSKSGMVMFIETHVNNGNGDIEYHWEYLEDGDIADEGDVLDKNDAKSMKGTAVDILSNVILGIHR